MIIGFNFSHNRLHRLKVTCNNFSNVIDELKSSLNLDGRIEHVKEETANLFEKCFNSGTNISICREA